MLIRCVVQVTFVMTVVVVLVVALLTLVSASCSDEIADAIHTGDLYAARRIAAQYSLHRQKQSSAGFSAVVGAAAGITLGDKGGSGGDGLDLALSEECASAWKEHVDALLTEADALARIRGKHVVHAGVDEVSSNQSDEACTELSPSRMRWNQCCSSLKPLAYHALQGCIARCCLLGGGSDAHLLLPNLREISLTLMLPMGIAMRIEQDGFLRPFDVPTVLWPAGYLLSNWVADPSERHLWCSTGAGGAGGGGAGGVHDGGAAPLRILDLGTGTGSVAVAAALAGRRCVRRAAVLATDVANRSLALATANAALSDAPVEVGALDWNDAAAVQRVAARGPFELVTGAALQFESWENGQLWSVLEQLTRAPSVSTDGASANGVRATGEGGGSLVALAHTIGAIRSPPPSSGLVEVRRIPGTAYGMSTRWAASESDFEVVLLTRRPEEERRSLISGVGA